MLEENVGAGAATHAPGADIMVVDDTYESRQLLSDLLGHAGYRARAYADGEQALYAVLEQPPELILLDIRMPGIDGFEVCRQLKSNNASCAIPVIFISVQTAVADQVRGFRLGAVDFVPKPFSPEEVLARVGTHVALARARRQLESDRARLELRVRERTLALEREIDVRRQAQETLHLFQRVFEATSEAIYITDADARLIEVNPAFSRILGHRRVDVVGQRPSELCSPAANDDEEANEPEIWHGLREYGHWAGEIWDTRSNGERFPKWLEINVVRDGDGGELTNYVGVFSDITALRRTEQELQRMVYHDPLTGVGNRLMFRERLAQEIAVAKRQRQRLAVMFLDLDKFKTINDTLGHNVGDRFLIQVAELLRSELREGDLVARYGGDEFVLALRNIRDAHAALHVAAKLIERLGETFDLDGHLVDSGGSIGIALCPDDGDDVEQVIKHADTAMYWAKAAGRGQYRFYSAEADRLVQNELALEKDLRQALERNEFELYFQPQMAIGSGDLVGAEALLRWRHPVNGMVPPDRFVALAEESNLIVEIGYWVVREACRQLRRFSALAGRPLTMAINLSPRQFQQPRLADEIARIVTEEGVPASSIELEITETTSMADAETAAEVLRELATRQFSIAIDDFGTGYSSLAYLKRFAVDKLKIDRSFVKDIPGDSNDAVIAAAVIRLAKSLGLRVVAEGVETLEQRHFLAAHGCDLLQGYWYARPLDAAAFEDFIDQARAPGSDRQTEHDIA